MQLKEFFMTAAVLLGLMSSCGETKKNDAQDQSANAAQEASSTISGEYYYSEEGAVLKGNTFIYAVTMDDMAKALGDAIAAVKQDQYDMVPVMVKGIVSKNPALDEGQQVWEQIITIQEIISIADKAAEADIKIEEAK